MISFIFSVASFLDVMGAVLLTLLLFSFLSLSGSWRLFSLSSYTADKSGCVSADMLIKIIKHDFGLTIDIEELIRAIDTDGSGEIEFEEFKTLLS